MKNYVEVIFECSSNEQSELLIAALADIGFDGFEETPRSLKAFVPEDAFVPSDLDEIARAQNKSFSSRIIEPQNWNELWESNFQPVMIEDTDAKPVLHIRASFHEPLPNMQEIVINPKMSFGTGHHPTTWLMANTMADISFSNRSVFDFGTGTGILAIYAKLLGASQVVAIDNEDNAIENAIENAAINKVEVINFAVADQPPATGSFDIILANINLNVILSYLPALKLSLIHI